MPDSAPLPHRFRTTARRRQNSVLMAVGILLAAAAMLAFGALAMAAPPGESDGAPPPATPETGDETVAPLPTLEPGARVIIREIGRRRHAGVLEELSDDIVIIRDPKGEVRSFPRTRVVEITSLLSPESGRDMAVFRVDGQVRVGLVIEDGWDRVVLEVDGVRVVTPRDEISTTRILPTFTEELAHRRSILNPENALTWTDFCAWLVDQERWTMAAEETARLLERHPRAREAEHLRLIANGQLALAASLDSRRERAGDAVSGGADSGAESDPARELESLDPENDAESGDMFERSRLSDRDVNTIRVFEIDFRDPPRVMIPRPLVQRIVTEYGDSPLLPADDRERARLHQAEPIDLVRLIFELRARDLYPEIQVLTEPETLKIYRRAVHDSWLMNTCVTCHAEPGVGGFRLHATEPRSVRTAMSNLLILTRLEMPEGPPLIDWEDPVNSRIIQYALPRFRARYPHPEVEGFRPAFRDAEDRRVEQSLRWIRSMFRPRPTYPVSYDPAQLIQAADDIAAIGDPEGGERTIPPVDR